MSKELATQFARWLERHGAQLKPTTNQWEAVRWSPANSTTTHVMYLKKTGTESFSSDAARQHWLQFLEDEDDGETLAKPSARPELKAPAATLLKVQPVRQVHLSSGADVHDEKGRWVATIHGVHGAQYAEIDSFVANCHLIGAAPQMLAALQAALKYIDDYNCQDPDAAKPVLGIQQAIELATKGPQ